MEENVVFLPLFYHAVVVNVDNQPILLQLCDTAGQVRRSSSKECFRDIFHRVVLLNDSVQPWFVLLLFVPRPQRHLIEVTLMRMLSESGGT